MTNLHGTNVLLGISGGIAAYKSAEIVRLLIKKKANVRVCLTQSAVEFITPLTLQALSGNPVHTDLFNIDAEAAMGHIELAKWADIILIAPATANTIAKIAHGFADNLLTTLILATNAHLYIAPAMNQAMWKHPQTQENIKKILGKGQTVLKPATGEQACGDVGPGRMLEPQSIITQLLLPIHAASSLLENTSILVTAGPTREAIDPVRYLTNRSSGKMGYAIAEAAQQQGANVVLVSGPVNISPPSGIECHRVESAHDMQQVVKKLAEKMDIFISSAAVADYSAASIEQHKIKKSEQTLTLVLKKNPDILSDISHAMPHLFTVGFAAETTDLENHARKKLIKKNLNMIAANKVGTNLGFDVDENSLLVLWKKGQTTLPLTNKKELAEQLISLIAKHYHQDLKLRKTR